MPRIHPSFCRINDAFAKATTPGSPGKERVTKAELQKAVKIAKENGLVDAWEKTALASNWASLFNGQEYMATPAAQREYARVKVKYNLPSMPVM